MHIVKKNQSYKIYNGSYENRGGGECEGPRSDFVELFKSLKPVSEGLCADQPGSGNFV